MSALAASAPAEPALGLEPRWLAAALPSSLAFVGPDREIEIALEVGAGDMLDALDALHPLVDRAALAAATNATREEADELIASLVEGGVLVEGPPTGTPPVTGLCEALLAVRAGEAVAVDDRAAIVTADELLLLPAGMGVAGERRALRAFVGGIAPDLRLRAYCQVAAAGTAVVRGDRPPAAVLERVLTDLPPDDERVRVVDLATGATAVATVEEVGDIGCERPHRLGPLLACAPLARADEAAGHGMHLYASQYAVANLRYPTPAADRAGGGRAATPELAELIARAEAAERYASGDVGRHEVLRARAEELDAPAVAPTDLFRGNARQDRRADRDPEPYDPTEPHLWVAGTTPAGERRWVFAEAVFYPLDDPRRAGRALLTSSSGSAAHTTVAEARLRALGELVERDAFMWTWIQRVARERIDEASLPAALAERIGLLDRAGLTASFVNLTLDLLPVVACVIHARDRLVVTTACSLDPADAARRALDEGLGLVEMLARGRLEPVPAEEVRMPEQHAALYLDPERVELNLFLAGSEERVALGELTLVDADPDLVVSRVAEPITVDLTSPASAPFDVVRVVVPGIVPVSFGYDREPLGMPRLAAPKQTHDGRVLGAQLDLAEAGPLDPHPFA